MLVGAYNDARFGQTPHLLDKVRDGINNLSKFRWIHFWCESDSLMLARISIRGYVCRLVGESVVLWRTLAKMSKNGRCFTLLKSLPLSQSFGVLLSLSPNFSILRFFFPTFLSACRFYVRFLQPCHNLFQLFLFPLFISFCHFLRNNLFLFISTRWQTHSFTIARLLSCQTSMIQITSEIRSWTCFMRLRLLQIGHARYGDFSCNATKKRFGDGGEWGRKPSRTRNCLNHFRFGYISQ